jgi:hypothetical protein
MTPRILRLRTELERLEDTVVDCHPEVQGELRVLIEDMRAHLTELERAPEAEEEPSYAR